MKIFDWLYYFKEKFKNSRIDDKVSPIKTVQENPRDDQAVKSFNKSFEQQQQQMRVRSLKPHDPTCSDVLLCRRQKCFKRIPDKIVGKPKQVESAESVQDRKKRFTFKQD